MWQVPDTCEFESFSCTNFKIRQLILAILKLSIKFFVINLVVNTYVISDLPDPFDFALLDSEISDKK